MNEINNIEETEIIYEVRGRNDSWKVWYPDEGDIQTPLPVYNQEGKLKTVYYVGGDSGKLTESFVEHSNARSAIKYAKELGAEKVKLIKMKERKKKES